MHELRYFKDVIALSDNLNDLWLSKCQLIAKKTVRWHEALRIFKDGKELWNRDYLPSFKEASFLASESQ